VPGIAILAAIVIIATSAVSAGAVIMRSSAVRTGQL
jgi:hypothetical protein